MRVNNFLTIAIVGLGLALTACQNSQTDPTSDYKSLSNGIPPRQKPANTQIGSGHIYGVHSPDASSTSRDGNENRQNFTFRVGESKSVRINVATHLEGLVYAVALSGQPEGMTLTPGDQPNEYKINWNPSAAIIQNNGRSGTFQISVKPGKGSSAQAIELWKSSRYAEETDFGWSIDASPAPAKVDTVSAATSPEKKTTTASAPQPTKVVSVGAMSVTFKVGQENLGQFAFSAENVKDKNATLKINWEEVNRVDLSSLPGKPAIKQCKSAMGVAFKQECEVFWNATCGEIGSSNAIKPQYTVKIKAALAEGSKVTTSTFDYVIKFDKTKTCNAADVKPAATSAPKK